MQQQYLNTNQLLSHNIPPTSNHFNQPNPGCRCFSPLSIVLLPGQHVHPCPVHPKMAIYGQTCII